MQLVCLPVSVVAVIIAVMVVCGENFVHIVRAIDPDEPSNIPSLLACESTQAASQSFRLNDFAPWNM